ncbi:MAG TPA: KOW domain-containing RNA-binding protein [Syntrophomonadaceae bacterium]|nr:KOW domain-containing RNA-binding protein [Syntrophomonadaceae bacterium]
MDERIGMVAYSKAGRDKGRLFVVVKIIDEKSLMLADGDLRRIEKPKVKNIKHVKITNIVAENIKPILIAGEMPDNHLIRKNLKELQKSEVRDGKEVW